MQRRVNDLQEKRNCKEAREALVKMFLFHSGEVDDRWKTEIPSYVLVIVATIIAMLLAWN